MSETILALLAGGMVPIVGAFALWVKREFSENGWRGRLTRVEKVVLEIRDHCAFCREIRKP